MGAWLGHILETVTAPAVVRGVVWTGLAALTVALFVLMRTRWGESQTLRKCFFLSLLAHMLMAGYSTTIYLTPDSPGHVAEDEPAMNIMSVDSVDDGETTAVAMTQAPQRPWEQFVSDVPAPPAEIAEPAPSPLDAPQVVAERIAPELAQLPSGQPLPDLPLADALPRVPTQLATTDTPIAAEAVKAAEPIDEPAASRRIKHDSPLPESDQPPAPADTGGEPYVAPFDPAVAATAAPGVDEPLPAVQLPDYVIPRTAEAAPNDSLPAENPIASTRQAPVASNNAPFSADAEGVNPGANPALAPLRQRGSSAASGVQSLLNRQAGLADVGEPALEPLTAPGSPSTGSARGSGEYQLPKIYQGRVAPDRARLSRAHGGTDRAEKAVKAALAWLAANQSTNGRWDARKFGAGRETHVDGRDRQGAGADADTAVTGLALLAFLGAGQTHLEGDYRENVRRGLNYLAAAQARDGNLGGNASLYAFMYCHGMATLALSEAFAMTGDERLERPVRRAIGYTLAAQHPVNGGWRYQRGDPQGDTSQLGWQLMALRSAELAGIPIPDDARQGMVRFLRSVESGRFGGLASYRSGEAASRPMTAEALVCRQMLGMSRDNPASDEAGDFIVQELPGDGPENVYYWYYGTLATYQLQGGHWQQWNEALQNALVESQVSEGPSAGSWDPDTIWGNHGGRVYSTAMSALCLEIYYRYLPLYIEAAANPRTDRK